MKRLTEYIRLFERLGESIKIKDKFLEKLCELNGITKIQFINEKLYKLIIYYNNNLNKNLLNMLMNFCGYANDILNSDDNVLLYEAVHPEKIKHKFKKYYHVTNINSYNKIKNQGLIPKQKHNYIFNKYNLEYPKRIYLWEPTIPIDVIKLFARTNNIKNNEIVILEVMLPEYIPLYGDPAHNLNAACFVEEPIDKKYIKVFEK